MENIKIDIIGTNKQYMETVQEVLVNSALFKDVYIDTKNNDMENTDITICTNFEKINELTDYYGKKILISGVTPNFKEHMPDDVILIEKLLLDLNELPKIIYNIFLKELNE